MMVRCQQCDEPFTKNREWQKFCCADCRTKNFLRTQKMYVAIGRKIREQMNDAPRRDLFAA